MFPVFSVRWQVKFANMSSKKNKDGDERFLRVQKDPRFWEMPERERKVKIDKRFQSMFHDKRFKVKYTVDKRGRPINHTSTEDLKRFYNISDSEDEEDEDDVKSKKVAEGKKKKKVKEKLVKADGAVKKEKPVQSRDANAKAEQPERGVRVFEEGVDMFLILMFLFVFEFMLLQSLWKSNLMCCIVSFWTWMY